MTTLIARRVVIVGGGGHIGLPLALVLTNIGHFVTALDVNEQAVETINSGTMPFMEEGAETLLKQVLKTSRFVATTDMQVLADAEIIIICIGTPVDEHLSPVPRVFTQLLDSMKPWLNSSQLLILRSTVYPGSTKLAGAHLSDFKLDIAFCPERILQGKAIEELGTLPNIISGLTESAIKRAEEFFSDLGPVVLASVEEAEFAKLNSQRQINCTQLQTTQE
jgi:UDP-N-acetyl-D-mannosaminuronic acid dehydrogenase